MINKSFVVFDNNVFAEKSFGLRLWKIYSYSLLLNYFWIVLFADLVLMLKEQEFAE